MPDNCLMSADQVKPDPDRSPLRVILFIAFVDLISFGLIIPLQAVYTKRLGANAVTFGCLVGVYALMQIIFNPILGRWSDRVGRRRVLLISVAGSVVSHALLGFADLAQSLPLLFLARMLDGITGANVATAQAYIADVTTPENRAKGMGMFGAAFGAGFVIGPAIGALLSYVGDLVSGPESGTSWPAFGAAVISTVAFVLVLRNLPEPPRHAARPGGTFALLTARGWREIAKTPLLKELFIFVFGVTIAFVLFEATLVYLCADVFKVTERGMGLIFAYFGVLMIIVQGGLVGRLSKRFGESRLLTIGPLITAAGLFALSGLPDSSTIGAAWMLLIFASALIALGHGLTGPNVNALISKSAGETGLGMTFGASQGVASIARAIAPPLAGLFYEMRAALPYWIGSMLMVLMSILAFVIHRGVRRQVDG